MGRTWPAMTWMSTRPSLPPLPSSACFSGLVSFMAAFLRTQDTHLSPKHPNRQL